MTPDLKQATVFCARLGASAGEGDQDSAMILALNRVAPKIRGLLGKKIDLKFTPSLEFKRDETFDEAERIRRLLARPDVSRDLAGD